MLNTTATAISPVWGATDFDGVSGQEYPLAHKGSVPLCLSPCAMLDWKVIAPVL